MAIIDKFYNLGLFNNPSLLWEPTKYVTCTCLLLNESRTWLTWVELRTQSAKNGTILQINRGNEVKYSPT